jgi:mono/diheme cytochrome c family protein
VISRLKIYCTVLWLLSFFAALPAHALFGSKTKAAEQAGALLFRDKGCAHCHGADGTGGKKGPALTDLRKNKLWTPAKITDQIMNGGQKMPAFRESVSDEEAAQLVAWLRAKHRPVAPAAK